MFQGIGIDPKLIEQAHEIGKHIELEVEYDSSAYSIMMALKPVDEEGDKILPQLLDSLVQQLCASFNMYFGIKGKIIKYE